MTKFLKYTFGILILLIATLLIVPFFISLDTYKEKIAEQAKKHTGRNLTIAGKISIDLFPMPEVKIEKVSLSSIKGAKAKNLFEAGRLLARLEFAPLLHGEVSISSIEILKPIINLEKLKNSKASWEFESSSAPSEKGSKSTAHAQLESKSAKEKVPLSINNISIKKGRLNYSDSNASSSIEDFNIKISLKDLYNLPARKKAPPRTPKGNWDRDKIDLSSLAAANATFLFDARKIKSGKNEIDNLMLQTELKDSTLKINSLSGYILGGKFEGMGSISGKLGQKIDLKLALNNAQIRDIAPEMNRVKITSGSIDFGMNIKSKGQSQYEYVKNLQGDVHLLARDGVLSRIDLAKLTSALNKPRDIAALAQNLSKGIGKGQTPFSSLSNDISIENGIVDIKRCELASGETSASAKGKVNLPDFTMNTYATVNSGVKNMPPIGVKLYGPIDNMQHKIDVKAIWQHFAKNALTGVVDNLKQGKIKPKDLLRGILETDNGSGSSSSDNKNKTPPRARLESLSRRG